MLFQTSQRKMLITNNSTQMSALSIGYENLPTELTHITGTLDSFMLIKMVSLIHYADVVPHYLCH